MKIITLLAKRNRLVSLLSLCIGGLIFSSLEAQTASGGDSASRPGLSQEMINAAKPRKSSWVFHSAEKPGLVITDTTLQSPLGMSEGLLPTYGFVPVELEIENFKDSPRELAFSLTCSEAVIPIVVPAREKISKTVYFPLSPLTSGTRSSHYNNALTVTDGRGLRGSGRNFSGKGPQATIAAGSINFLHRDALAASLNSTFVPLFFQDLPADWRLYSSFDVIVLDHGEFQSLDKARQIKILEWTAHGGNLILNHFDPVKGNLAVGPYSQGIIHSINIDTSDRKAMQGFYTDLEEKYKRNLNFASNELSPAPEEYSFFLPKAIALCLLMFVVIVGPVNLWIFAPVGKRQRLFWTTPVITVSSGVLLFIFILLVDGFGGAGRRLVYVDLFPHGNSAWITQSQVSRTGILTETSFTLAEDILFSSRGLSERNSWFDSGTRYTSVAKGFTNASSDSAIRLANVASGYFTSRGARWQNISTNVLYRGELNMVDSDKDGSPVLLSSLPSVLTDFKYKDEEGRDWVANEIRPGQKTTLKPSPTTDRLGKGMFSAQGEVSEKAPVDTLPSIKWSDTVIYRGPVVKK